MPKLSLHSDMLEVLEMFPKLKSIDDKKNKSLIGEVDVFDTLGNYVDSYEIKVLIPVNYPYGFPLLFETSNKFEHSDYRHISDDGSCCVCSLQEADVQRQRGITIKYFFLKYVIPYFANQLYFDSKNKWANGDWEHGFEGIEQFYMEVFKIDDVEKILAFLVLFTTEKIHRNEKCFCGESKKLKHCHLKEYNKIKDLSIMRIKCDILVLKKLISDRDKK